MEAELEAIKTRPLSAGFGKKSVSRFPSNNSRAASIDNNGKLSATLERKNKQLNQATKQLEEKVKSLKEKTTKQRSLPKVAKVSIGAKLLIYATAAGCPTTRG
jgi:cell division protein FtsB